LLAAHQQRILRAALERDALGRFRWTTVVYSCPKKSGKTRVAALVAAWLAATMGRYNEIYCLANDGKQSADRVLAAVKKANELGRMGWRDKMTRIELPNGSFIEAVPVDPTGEAGANPTATLWSEMWGFRLSAKERLWTEFTIPPTRHGKAIRWVESVCRAIPASHRCWSSSTTRAWRRASGIPTFPTCRCTSTSGRGCSATGTTTPRMPWQTPEYYEAEAALLHPSEFQRIHRNDLGQRHRPGHPGRGMGPLPGHDAAWGIHPQTPVVLGLDAGVSGDCTRLLL
jgi:hypothetical protein